jgi:anaerobic ribonucleoside-triphosphate reductase activating protein
VSDLRVNGIVEESIVDGPGLRFVVFTQGCPHRCPGCHNPETHDASGGYLVATETLFEQFARNPLLSGVTFSGGEPFQQPEPLAELAARVHGAGGTVVVYTGHTVERLHELAGNDKAVRALLEQADTLVDGPYREDLRETDSGFRGSSNQRILEREAVREIRRKCSPAA